MHRTVLLATLLAAAACANPVPPSGGPEDRTPPGVVTSDPAAGAVHVTADAVTLLFSEYVDAASFQRALSVTPAFDLPLDVTFRGRQATIRFPEPLRPNTTYILTVDTGLRDLRGVRATQPYTLAFSTGSEVSRGRIVGRVVGPEQGAPVAGLDVYAYATTDTVPPAPLPDRPAYRTQTDPEGGFTFDYLTEGPYYVIALGDRNRDRRPDPGEPFAVPPRPVVVADTVGAPLDAPWVAAALDTTAPAPQRVRAHSASRLAVRFSEPVRLTARDPDAWVLRDSLEGTGVPVLDVYTVSEAPTEVFVITDPLRPAPYRLRPAGVADTSGNAVTPGWVGFTATAVADTTRARLLGLLPAAPAILLPHEAPAVRYNVPLSDSLFRAAVTATDTSGTPRPYTWATDDGTTYRLLFDPPLEAGASLRIAVRQALLGGPDTTAARTFTRIAARDLGGRAGIVAAPGTTGTLVVELYPVDPEATRERPFTTTADADGRYHFPALPEGTYRLRAFLDRDGDGIWDPGRVVPYEPAEPIAWGPDVLPVEPRWDREDPDTLWVLR